MEKVWEWLSEHYVEVLAYLGIGGGSGVLGKKLTDRQQDAKIKALQEDMKQVESSIATIDNKLETNTILDKQLRNDLKEHREKLNSELSEIKKSVNMMLSHLLNK